MGPAAIGALAQTGGGLIASGINAWSTSRQNKLNREFAITQANEEWRRNKEMWNMQNQYNEPSQQMARFKKAGLNPNLIYGKGTAGNSAQLPKYNAPQWKGVAPQISVLQELSAYQDIKIKQEQRKNIFSDTMLKMQLTDEKLYGNMWKQGEADYIHGKNDGVNKLPDYSRQMVEQKYRKAKLDNDLTMQRKGLTSWQREWARLKYQTMTNSRINLDKDKIWERILEKVIMSNKGGIRSGIGSLINYGHAKSKGITQY